ncbi:hypothetical protein HPP92_006742 [Vanilla planifolia]|uniref:Uncharacterized protein n=1 Tax=Vanilla planifolia TaxID=51239 RepID=A0A835V721_VANPL|nr:hypothetical protein HPP92_006742 [Vanilla planifolia]
MHAAAPPRLPGSSADIAAGIEVPRVYEVWKGSNVFLLNGRFIFGPDARSLILTIFLIVAPVAIFCIFVARKLMDKFSHHLGISVMVVAVAFTLYDLCLLLLTSGRDPGIIPRNTQPPESECYDGSLDVGGVQTPQLRLPRTKDVIINGITVKIKYATHVCFIASMFPLFNLQQLCGTFRSSLSVGGSMHWAVQRLARVVSFQHVSSPSSAYLGSSCLALGLDKEVKRDAKHGEIKHRRGCLVGWQDEGGVFAKEEEEVMNSKNSPLCLKDAALKLFWILILRSILSFDQLKRYLSQSSLVAKAMEDG